MRDSFVMLGGDEEVAVERTVRDREEDPAKRKDQSPSPHRVRDPSPRIHPKYLDDDEVTGPPPSSREHLG